MSLSDKAMLVVFNVSMPQFDKLDAKASRDVTEDNKARPQAARVHKSLFDKTALTPLKQLVGAARNWHYAQTLPWLDNGPRILTGALFQKYWDTMGKDGETFHTLGDVFVSNYPTYRLQARDMLGELYNENDYPSVDKIKRQFQWHLHAMPLPDAGDFRVDIGNEELARVRADIEARTAQATTLATRDIFERVHKVCSHMAESLTGYVPSQGNGKRATGVFRDSLVTNVVELIDLLPGLNFTGDARVTKLCESMAALVKHDATTLRESDNLRATTRDAAQEIVQAVEAFM